MTGSTHAVAGAPPMDTDSAPSGSLEGIEGWSHCRTRSQPGHGTSEGGACQVCIRRDPLVGSDKHPSIIQSFFAGTTSVPLRPFGGTCLSGPLVGGTCLSRPPPNVRSSIGVHRGLKSRAERGAKAPHSMECGDSSPLFDEGFSLHHLGVCGVLPRPRKRAPGRGHS